MDQIKRFAVYYAPPAGDFADVAAAWLGWDAALGCAVQQPDLGLPAAQITTDPRKYGFHGTIKPPFRLAEGQSEADLRAGLAALARQLAPVVLPGLRLKNLDGFLALVPQGDAAALGALAEAVVKGLEPFRAPLNAAEMAKRRPERLTPRQLHLLQAYGYPFVMEEFRFHLTLTNRLSEPLASLAADRLAAHFAPVIPQPFIISDLCLFGEAADGRFHLLHRYTLFG